MDDIESAASDASCGETLCTFKDVNSNENIQVLFPKSTCMKSCGADRNCDTSSAELEESVSGMTQLNLSDNENCLAKTCDFSENENATLFNFNCNDIVDMPAQSMADVPIDDTGQDFMMEAEEAAAVIVCNGKASLEECISRVNYSENHDETVGYNGSGCSSNLDTDNTLQPKGTAHVCDMGLETNAADAKEADDFSSMNMVILKPGVLVGSKLTEVSENCVIVKNHEITDISEADESGQELSSATATDISENVVIDEFLCGGDEPSSEVVCSECTPSDCRPPTECKLLTSEINESGYVQQNCLEAIDNVEIVPLTILSISGDTGAVLDAPETGETLSELGAIPIEALNLKSQTSESTESATLSSGTSKVNEKDVIALLLNADYDVPKSLKCDSCDCNLRNGLDEVAAEIPGDGQGEDVIYDVPPEFEDDVEIQPEPPAKDYFHTEEPPMDEDLSTDVMPADICENVYEEISKNRHRHRKASLGSNESKGHGEEAALFNRGSLVEEVMTEVERVQQRHAQVLQELNLDIENLIMPATPSVSPLTENATALPYVPPHADSGAVEARNFNLCARTLPPLPVESSEEPIPLRPAPSTRELYQTKSAPAACSTPQSSTPSSTPTGVKHWFARLPSLSSFREKKDRNDSSDAVSWRWSVGFTEEPIYMLYDDSYRLHGGPRLEFDDGIYEDIDNHSQRCTIPSTSPYVPLPKFQYADRQSLSSTECNEDNSDTESIRSGGSLSVASFKGKLLNFGRKLSRQEDKPKELKNRHQENDGKVEGKLTRLFSKRKGYDLKGIKNRSVIVQTPEESRLPQLRMSSRHQPPILPPPPTGLSPEQVKRRYIVGTLVHNENSYIASLKKLVNDYKKPLEDSSPPILSANKIAVLFHRLPEILQCHTNFCIALASCIQRWDKEESIGEVFLHAFSKTSVLDIYSEYINNFSEAMDLAKIEAKRKSAFTDFLKVKQITSHDRLSFFGLMVKPVQRFPQFILLLQDLLRHTPQRHHDRMALQLALTQMETMADMLNERKRESDQAHAVKDVLRHVSAKSAAKSLSEGTRYLLRQDMLNQLIFNQNGQWMKSKDRKLFLLNDLLVCVSVGPSDSNSRKSERLSFKWTVPITEVEVQEDASPILNRMVHAMSTGQSSATKTDSPNGPEAMEGVKNIYQDLNDLLHDFEVTSRITALVSTLRKSYPEVSVSILQGLSHSIQQTIQQKDEEIKWIDSCCLQFSVPLKTKTGKSHRDLLIFQSKSMDTKQEWLTDVRLAQLARDANNSPAWDIPEQERRPSTKIPLFVKAVPVHSSGDPTEVKCGCYHRTMSTRLLGRRPQDLVWLCSTDGVNSHISVHTLRQMGLRDVFSFDMTECRISAMESVPGSDSPSSEVGLHGDSIWMGTESRRVLVYGGSDAEHYQEIGCAVMTASVLHIKFHISQVYVALANGTVAVFQRNSKGCWQMKDFQVITLGSDPVTCLLPVNNSVYCGCGRKVWVVDSLTAKVILNHSVHHDHMGSVYAMAHSGIGLWLNLRNTPLICLYHAETFQHLQDINITSSVRRVLAEQNRTNSPRYFSVTTLAASRGLLWIGTNVGVVLSIPLPRLQGMPILGRRANMAYHANVGPVSMILVLQLSNTPLAQKGQKANKESRIAKEAVTKSSENNYQLPAIAPIYSNAFRSSRLSARGDSFSNLGIAKTLPRSWKSHVSQYDPEYSIYGLYDNLLNVREGAEDPVNSLEEDLRHSDPDLIPSLVSTLDRRVRLNSGRPRSLDLANLTSANDGFCVSSSSEDGGSGSQSLAELPEYIYSIHSQIKEMEDAETSVQNEQIGREKAAETLRKPPKGNPPLFQRSVVTLVGGRGYVDLRKPLSSKEKSGSASNSYLVPSDAYAILWEMKV